MDNKTQYIIIIASMLIMLGLALGLIWFFIYAQKKIVGTKLKQKEQELAFQKDLLMHTVSTQEQERNRIAKELHDDVGSQLNIANLNMHLLKNKIDQQDSDMQILLTRMEQSLQNSAVRTREISHELIPPVFQNFGFVSAVDELSNSINNNGLNMQVEGADLLLITDKMKQLHLFRIIQELINNTLKYANATTIMLTFNSNQHPKLSVTYSDNGKGFNSKATKMGLGLSNIESRVALLNGSFQYSSQPNHGFLMTLTFSNHD